MDNNNTSTTNSITLTPAALAHFRNEISKAGKGIGIRLSVKTVGCSGKKYVTEIAEAFEATDHKFNAEELVIGVDQESFDYLKGTEIDYSRTGLNQALKFNNPNVKNTCGCGESFNV